MEIEEYERMFRAEDSHWWYRGMQAITLSVLKKHLPIQTNLKILDAGCGTGGAMSTYLGNLGTVTGFDLSPVALAFAQKRDQTRLAQASVSQIPFPAETFELVTSFDVLYERAVSDDGSALAEIRRVLRPGGFLFLRLPAYNWLRGQHDATIHTARRYTTHQVKSQLEKTGFKCLYLSYANTFLFPLAAAKRLLERFFPPQPGTSDLSLETGLLASMLEHILTLEAALLTQSALPFGLSVIALGEKCDHPKNYQP